MAKDYIGAFSTAMAAIALWVDSQGAPTKSGSRAVDPALTIVYATGKNEGSFSSAQPNISKSTGTSRDGLSYGLIQWTQSSGSLGKVLSAMQAADPTTFAKVLGPSWKSVIQVATDSRDGNVSRTVDGAALWQEPWVSRLRTLGGYPSMQKAQLEVAKKGEYMQAALAAAAALGLPPTTRTIGVLFDRAVQQGAPSVRSAAKRLAEDLEESSDTGDTGAGELEPQELLRALLDKITSKFRRKSPPDPGDKNAKSWRQVGNEWHLFHSTGADLYLNTRGRIEKMLANPTLDDVTLVRA